MPEGRNMSDQEMLKEIKRIIESTSRIEERIKIISENDKTINERFDKFIDQYSHLAERVIRLESTTWSGEKIEQKVEAFEEINKKLDMRLFGVESSAPTVLKIVDGSLEALNKLTDRVNVLEKEAKRTEDTVKTWQSWLSWFCDWCFKVAWIVIAAYILARIGLGGVGIPAPF